MSWLLNTIATSFICSDLSIRTIESSCVSLYFTCPHLAHLSYTSMSLAGSSSLCKYPPAFREQCFLFSTAGNPTPTGWAIPSIPIPAKGTTSSSGPLLSVHIWISNFLLASSHRCPWGTVNSLKGNVERWIKAQMREPECLGLNPGFATN